MFNLFYKIFTIVILVFVVLAGLLNDAPRLNILNETIRNLHFHVPMWFGMLFMLLASMVYSVRYLRNARPEDDIWARELAHVGLLFGVLGLLTGMWWAQFTWGKFWSGDPKQNASAVAMLIYLAYFLLRNSFDDFGKGARIAAVFNIFAFATYVPLIYILPRLTNSLHPGASGNPGFNAYDLDSQLRYVFYPAVLGWSMLGFWIAHTRKRMALLWFKIDAL
ncbi:MAG: ABC transporter permease [Cytophagales bacterium]|nr:MAG: ABC transporter permease [Cytophagales bacterium]TAF61682.1 MAG: ABC transporter permease [Cytophagales bacterium]